MSTARGQSLTAVAVVAASVALLPPSPAAAAAPAESVVLASLGPDGTTGNGVSGTFGLAMSGDGAAVAFTSMATNLHPQDGDAQPDVYVKDLATGTLALASVTADGVKGNRLSLRPSLDADARRVAFVSGADNLDPADTDQFADVYVKDLDAGGRLRLASSDGAGRKGAGDSTGPSLSADGRAVAFISRAPDLHPDDADSLPDVFVKDLESGALALATTTSDGTKALSGYYGVGEVSISSDGTRVAFDTDAALDPRDTDTAPDVYVKDVVTGCLSLASLGSDGRDSARGSYRPTLSGDGNVVAFDSFSADLATEDQDEDGDVFVKDLRTGELTLVSSGPRGKGDGRSTNASLSADGRRVAFSSNATNLVPGDQRDTLNTYVKDLDSGAVDLASANRLGAGGNALSIDPALAGGGSAVGFATAADDLGPPDTNGLADVYVRHLEAEHPEPAEDRTAPGLSLSVTPDTLSSRGQVTVMLSGTASDTGSGLADVRMQVHDEYGQLVPVLTPVDGGGSAELSFVRRFGLSGSARQGDADGRDYTITAVARDIAGNSVEEHVHVTAWKHRHEVVALSTARGGPHRGGSAKRPAVTKPPRHDDGSTRPAGTARRTGRDTT